MLDTASKTEIQIECQENPDTVADLGLISVIIPVYNVEKYLGACIESVLAQTYPYFELLLVDDGATDSSPQICDEYAQKDSRVRVIHKPNGGVSSARNRGIDESKGAYIMFVDSDDLILPTMLMETITTYDKFAADLVLTGFERFTESSSTPVRLTLFSKTVISGKFELASLYSKPATNMFGVSIWAKLYRADIIREHGLRFDMNISYEEDCVFNLSYFPYVQTAVALKTCHYRYRQMETSLSKGYRKNTFKFLVNGFNGRSEFMRKAKMPVKDAQVIFSLVVKNTLRKIYYSDLPKEEKLAEYAMVAGFAESRECCKLALNSPNKFNRQLFRAVVDNSPARIHRVHAYWDARESVMTKLSKIKSFAKKAIKKVLGKG